MLTRECIDRIRRSRGNKRFTVTTVAQMSSRAGFVLDMGIPPVPDVVIESLPELEETNFRVDSMGWREIAIYIDSKKTRVKLSPRTDTHREGEIIEILE